MDALVSRDAYMDVSGRATHGDKAEAMDGRSDRCDNLVWNKIGRAKHARRGRYKDVAAQPPTRGFSAR